MKIHIILLLSGLMLTLTSCGEAFLDVKPSQNQRIPATLADYQALLDNATSNADPMNIRSSHTLGMIGADEFQLTEAKWKSFPAGVNYSYMKNAYTWEQQIYEGREGGTVNPIDFETGYKRILRCNLVLDGLTKLNLLSGEEQAMNNARGSALFYRAFDYYNLAQLYCPVYQSEEAESTLGLPLRLNPDPTIKLTRASLAATYQQVLKDLEEALPLLEKTSLVLFRPSKTAVFALLARVYLQMGNYVQAEKYALLGLGLKDQLLDFNTLTIGSNYTFPLYGNGNPEVIFNTTAFNAAILDASFAHVDASLLAIYTPGDLRYKAYFRKNAANQILFYGSYYGNNLLFTGLATDELYLVAAESMARLNKTTESMKMLNTLRKCRYEKDSFVLLETTDAQQVLDWVIEERRKELAFRGLRWEDLRRLNKEPRYAKKITRQLGTLKFELLPNTLRWTWPFPLESIQLGNYVQNAR